MSGAELSKSSADFVAAFAALAKRLAEIEVIVSDLRLYYDLFGSWELVATKGSEAVRFFFDGRDSFVTAEISPVRKDSFPNEWERVDAKGISGRYPESIAYAEEFLRKKSWEEGRDVSAG